MNILRMFLIGFILYPVIVVSQVAIQGDLSQDVRLNPGDKYSGRILVKNIGDSTVSTRAYQNDYSFTSDNKKYFNPPGTSPRSNASWIFISPTQFAIPPKEMMIVNYEINVPNDQKLAGTFWSIIMIEEISSLTPSFVQKQIGIQVRQRYGIQISSSIGDSTNISVNIFNKTINLRDSLRNLSVDIKNTGDVLIKPSVWLDVYDTSGKLVGNIKSDKNRIYPETSVRYAFNISPLLQGSYNGIVVVDCGGEHVFGMNCTFKIEK
jgi:hypothetical protein